jgi:LDH2 family malate/lactate/ureidoglycolate dehydrogenase
VDGIIREMRASRRAAGVDRLYSPGELETETDQRYQSGGIPLNNATLSGIADAARSVGITALPWGG